MKVLIQDHYNDSEHVIEGSPEEIEHALLAEYPWLEGAHDYGDLDGMLDDLDSMQNFSVAKLDENAWLQPTPAPQMEKAEDILAKHFEVEPLEKMLGYLAFPGLGITGPLHEPKVPTNVQQLQNSMNLMNGRVARSYNPYKMKDTPSTSAAAAYFPSQEGDGQSAGGWGSVDTDAPGEGRHFGAALDSTDRKDSAPKHRQRHIAVAKDGPLMDLHGVVAHEAQHTAFGQIAAKYGQTARQEVAKRLFLTLPMHHRENAIRLAGVAGYGTDHRSFYEEGIVQHQNYLTSPLYRKHVHQKLGLPENSLEARQFHDDAKRAWKHLVQRAKEIDTPGPVMKAEGNLQVDGDSTTVDDMHGHEPLTHSAFEAARFLSGTRPAPSLDQVRHALWEFDGDPERAALVAFGIEPTEENLRALRSVMQMSGLQKDEPELQIPQTVEAGTPEAAGAAEEIKRAFEQRTVTPVKLNGKHSVGTMIARDSVTGNVYLLKPGSGLQSPAAGATDDPASQSKREAAFFAIAEAWGMEASFPRADLVIVDGKEWAALKLLPFNFKSVQKMVERDPGLVMRSLEAYRHSGLLHRWAVLDMILGNSDRHSDNLMIDENGTIKLIDHGSAFAGENFHPAYDRSSFVPFYLRAWGPKRFNTLQLDEKIRRMPTLSGQVSYDFTKWVLGLDEKKLESVLSEYGINAQPELERLARLKAMPGPKDAAINQMWVTT